MARFYFDIDDNGLLVRDNVGSEFPTLEAVRNEAISTLSDVASEAPFGVSQKRCAVLVRDDLNRPALRVTLTLNIQWLGRT